MCRKIIATLLALSVPAGAAADPGGLAGPIREAIERAGREIVVAQREEGRCRGRFWTGIGLIAGGGVLGTLGQCRTGR